MWNPVEEYQTGLMVVIYFIELLPGYATMDHQEDEFVLT